jgi:hypothetical protein
MSSPDPVSPIGYARRRASVSTRSTTSSEVTHCRPWLVYWAAQALRSVEDGHARGKIVIEVQQ